MPFVLLLRYSLSLACCSSTCIENWLIEIHRNFIILSSIHSSSPHTNAICACGPSTPFTYQSSLTLICTHAHPLTRSHTNDSSFFFRLYKSTQNISLQKNSLLYTQRVRKRKEHYIIDFEQSICVTITTVKTQVIYCVYLCMCWQCVHYFCFCRSDFIWPNAHFDKNCLMIWNSKICAQFKIVPGTLDTFIRVLSTSIWV